MKLSAKIEYAYKAVLELSLRYREERPIQLSTISEAQHIPREFLTQLFLHLKNANIVNSSRGVSGGYYLTRHPSRITLADVVKAIDDGLLSEADRPKALKASDSGRLIWQIWSEINGDITKKLEEVTFEQLIAQVKGGQPTYQI